MILIVVQIMSRVIDLYSMSNFCFDLLMLYQPFNIILFCNVNCRIFCRQKGTNSGMCIFKRK